jgi:hypothetical protein
MTLEASFYNCNMLIVPAIDTEVGGSNPAITCNQGPML